MDFIDRKTQHLAPKSFECGICSKEFKYMQSLKRHLKKGHSESDVKQELLDDQ